MAGTVRDGDVGIVGKADFHRVGTAFINFDLRNHFACVIQFRRVERLQRPVEQFAAFGSARLGGFGADHDGDNAAAVAVAGSGEVVTCAFRMAGFQAVDAAVAEKEQVAVGLLDAVVSERFKRKYRIVFRIIPNQGGGQQRQIADGGQMPFGSQSGRVVETGVIHAQTFGFHVHHGDEIFQRGFGRFGLFRIVADAADGFGQSNGGIVAGLDDHTFEQVADTDGNMRVQEHARAFGVPARIGNGQHFVGFKRAVFQCFESQISGHHLG